MLLKKLKNIEWFEVRYSFHKWYQRSFINQSYLWFAYRFIPKHRYNIVRTGMRPGYADVSVRVESALAQVLIDFVELEAYPQTTTIEEAVAAIHAEMDMLAKVEIAPHYNSISHISKLVEMRDLYIWAKKWQPVISYSGDDPFYDEVTKKYDLTGREVFEKEVDEIMIRILNLRNFLWT